MQSPGGPFGDFVILDELRRIGGRTHVSTGVTMLSCCGVTSSSLSGVEHHVRSESHKEMTGKTSFSLSTAKGQADSFSHHVRPIGTLLVDDAKFEFFGSVPGLVLFKGKMCWLGCNKTLKASSTHCCDLPTNDCRYMKIGNKIMHLPADHIFLVGDVNNETPSGLEDIPVLVNENCYHSTATFADKMLPLQPRSTRTENLSHKAIE